MVVGKLIIFTVRCFCRLSFFVVNGQNTYMVVSREMESSSG